MAVPSLTNNPQSKLLKFGIIEMDQSFAFTFFPLAILALLLAVISGHQKRNEWETSMLKSSTKPKSQEPKGKQDANATAQEALSPIQNFDITKAENEVFRPFKPKYHMSMGLERCQPNDLILLDKHYVERIKQREHIAENHHRQVIATSLEVLSGCYEFYRYMLGTHLPTRFPDYFTVDQSTGTFTNRLTGKSFPVEPPKTNNGVDAMKIIAVTIEEDVLMMIKNANGDYILKGFVACFPAGFDTSKKFGMNLREIHGPVPLYKEKIALSMDRFFAKLEVGKWVKRLNWGVSTNDELFSPIGNHRYEGELEEAALTEIDLTKSYLRVERQVLLRLPESKALMFCVKTYLTPLIELKKEGLGKDFATAIEGVPEVVARYKRREYWGDAVKAAMRS